MFEFLKRKQQFPPDFTGITDSHSHILPGVDDGVKTMKSALQILDTYERWGIREVWLTPHIMDDVPNTTEELTHRFEELKTQYKGGIKLNLAAEYMLDYNFETRLAARDLLCLGPKRILVETSYLEPPMNFDEILFNIITAGYTPILAHPERYLYMSEEKYSELKKQGVLLQLNWGSLGGLYGSRIKERAYRLLGKGMYDMSGSDIHTQRMYKFYTSILLDKGVKLPSE